MGLADDIWPKLATMAEMQERHNLLVHPQWASQGHDYYRAIWVECAELLDHFHFPGSIHTFTPEMEGNALRLGSAGPKPDDESSIRGRDSRRPRPCPGLLPPFPV